MNFLCRQLNATLAIHSFVTTGNLLPNRSSPGSRTQDGSLIGTKGKVELN